MPTIKIPKDQWESAWKFLTTIGPVTRISTDYIYEISAQQLEALCTTGFQFEIMKNESLKTQKENAEYRQAV
ncbi:MAG: hypothetical protein AAB071_01810 [Bacteroidota bacterium]